MASNKTVRNAWARYMKANCRLYHVTAMVRVEDVEDIPFWQTVLSTTCPGRRFKFWPYSQKGANNRVTGKSYLMGYVSQTDSRLLIAVDSDFDYLRGNPKMTASPYLLQTYTYSWENHHCYAQSLQRQSQQNGVAAFNFESFLRNLSQVIYKPLTILLIQKIQKKGGMTLSAIESRILRHQPNSQSLLQNDGQQLISVICSDLDSYVLSKKMPRQQTIKNYEKALNALGMTPENAYLYMQGHCIYNLVHRIGACLLGDADVFKADVLDKTLQMGGYYEIDKLISDIKRIYP